MTARPDPETRALVAALVAVLDARMTPAGHPYALVQTEHLGTCSVWGCSDRCVQYRELFSAGVRWLEENSAEPEQLELIEEVAR